jgi:hypothetical protein
LRTTWIRRNVVKVHTAVSNHFNIVHVSDEGRVHCSYHKPAVSGFFTLMTRNSAISQGLDALHRWHFELDDDRRVFVQVGVDLPVHDKRMRCVCIARWLTLAQIEARERVE